jgi:ribosome assembly protein 1
MVILPPLSVGTIIKFDISFKWPECRLKESGCCQVDYDVSSCSRYAQVEIDVSPAIVPFRETVIEPPKVDMVNEVIQQDQNQPKKNITRLLDEHADLIKTMDQYTWFSEKSLLHKGSKLTEEAIEMVVDFKTKLEAEFTEGGEAWKGAVDLVWAFGPRRCGPNILLSKIEGYNRPSVWSCVEKETASVPLREYDTSVVSGFQLATLSGPICEEPLMGVCFVLEGWEMETEIVTEISDHGQKALSSALSHVTLEEFCQCGTDSREIQISTGDICDLCSLPKGASRNTDHEDKMSEVSSTGTSMSRKHSYGPFTGQLMTAVKNGCRRAFQLQPQRLMAAMYTCQIQATADTLGESMVVVELFSYSLSG